MDSETLAREIIDQTMASIGFVPADPEKYCGDIIRGEFRAAYEAGLIDCIPKVTVNFGIVTGELSIHVDFPPKKVNMIEFEFTYDGKDVENGRSNDPV